MTKFYLKVQNNMLTRNLLYIVSGLVVIFNIIVRAFPGAFVNLPGIGNNDYGIREIVPTALFTYCDVYLLLLFIILIFFFLGSDFKNSMEEIALVSGASKTNKFMLRKLCAVLLLYLGLYIISFINIYTLYLVKLTEKDSLIPLAVIIFNALATNIFVLSLSLFLIILFKDIAVSTSIITAYYLIEEALWRCKITQVNGILGHIYQYSDYNEGQLLRVKLFYIMFSIILLLITYKLSQRKIGLQMRKLRH